MKEQLGLLMRSITKLYLVHRKCMLQRCQKCGLYVGQPGILDFVKKNPGCTQNEIADELGVSPASIAFSTRRLQASGFLMKQVNSLDMRRNKLYITTEGAEALEKFEKCLEKMDEKMFLKH